MANDDKPGNQYPVEEVPFSPYLRKMILAECQRHSVQISVLNVVRRELGWFLAIVIVCEDVTQESRILESTIKLVSSDLICASVPEGDEVIESLELTAKAGQIPIFAVVSDGNDERRTAIAISTQEIGEA